jgi:hypothetical protein
MGAVPSARNEEHEMNTLSLQRDTVLIRAERPANPSARASRRANRQHPAFDYLGSLYDTLKTPLPQQRQTSA